MKRRTLKITNFIIIALIVLSVGLVTAVLNKASAETDIQLEEIDRFIEDHTTESTQVTEELETVGLSYKEWQEMQEEAETEEVIDIYSMDIWTLGSYLYGISEIDTTRSLILISNEGYGAENILSYYVGCACWTRATNNYLGIGEGDLFTSFGGADTDNYGLWMDYYGWDSYAEDVLREVYLNPMYIIGCNGCDSPETWIYAEETIDGIIYVW